MLLGTWAFYGHLHLPTTRFSDSESSLVSESSRSKNISSFVKYLRVQGTNLVKEAKSQLGGHQTSSPRIMSVVKSLPKILQQRKAVAWPAVSQCACKT